ncbi:chemosensory receptor a [Plakobranchus ocellatus]|uniref:Chemosensory receptor a n=1 Tax=Plakobranchus ocellatus TaxID=259542 RepID=A0AAV3ZNY3_9GAST|nr:chemosensory receptor a [Plakobranchus ocellatus]
MNVSNTTVSLYGNSNVPKDPITDAILSYLSLVFRSILCTVLGVMGVWTNVINMAVFHKMGLSEGVTQNFFILSVSDFFISLMTLTNNIIYLLMIYLFNGEGGSSEKDTQILYSATTIAVTFPQNVSLITTVVIAVVRCCCVAMPLRVKFLVTASRQLAVILLFSASAAVVLLYAFTPIQVTFVDNPLTNSSLVVLVNLKWFTYTLFTNICFYSGFFIVIVCVIILAVSLYRSSNFRQKSTSGGSSSDDSQIKERRRETRVVITVVFVSVVFIVCYLPTLVFSVLGEVVKEYSAFGIYRNSNSFTIMVMAVALLVNVNHKTNANIVLSSETPIVMVMHTCEESSWRSSNFLHVLVLKPHCSVCKATIMGADRACLKLALFIFMETSACCSCLKNYLRILKWSFPVGVCSKTSSTWSISGFTPLTSITSNSSLKNS